MLASRPVTLSASWVPVLIGTALAARNVQIDWLLFALLVTFATDTAAYGIGRALGRHPLAPALSPGKTWEGALGGVAGALLAALGLATWLSMPLARWEVLALGLGIAIAGQFGDLAESMLKRGAGVGEASRLIPGHGGVLDRLDSVVLILPLVYYVAMGRVV
mgnify:CR=1 FL=1